MAHQTISSWKEAQTVVRTVLDQLNQDPALLMAAATNPVLALQELGYEIAPAFQQEFVDRVRFGPRTATRLRQLRKEIYSQAGETFDFESPRELEKVLFDRLKLSAPGYASGAKMFPAPGFSFVHNPAKDPLETLRGQHPVVDSLLEFRHLNTRSPKLASRKLFDQVRAGKHRLPFRLRARFKNAEHPGEK